MSEQPKALELADLLADGHAGLAKVLLPASVELRRQHAEIEALRHPNVDAVAKAIADKCGGDGNWERIGEPQRDGYRGIAKAAIGAMR